MYYLLGPMLGIHDRTPHCVGEHGASAYSLVFLGSSPSFGLVVYYVIGCLPARLPSGLYSMHPSFPSDDVPFTSPTVTFTHIFSVPAVPFARALSLTPQLSSFVLFTPAVITIFGYRGASPPLSLGIQVSWIRLQHLLVHLLPIHQTPAVTDSWHGSYYAP